MKRIVAINGLPFSGKDTIANHLVYKYGYAQFAFATELKAELADTYGVPVSVFSHRETKDTPLPQLALVHCTNFEFVSFVMSTVPMGNRFDELIKPRSPRWAMRTYGTDYRKAQDATYWIRPVVAGIQIAAQKGKDSVVSDLRFPDEGMALDCTPFMNYTMKVVRPGVNTQSEHISDAEYPIERIDYLIRNSGTVEQLLEHVDNIVKEFA